MRMRRYNVRVAVVNPMYLVVMGEPAVTFEWRVIEGTSKADALRRAGVVS